MPKLNRRVIVKMNKKPQNNALLEQQIVELTEALQRERADAMNVRRRAEEEKLKLASYYKAQVISELLPVIDNFERSLKHVPARNDERGTTSDEEQKLYDWVDGVSKILSQFDSTLEKLGLKRIKTVGEPFDPNLHEAVSAEGEGDLEVVSEELQSGWMIGDEVIRHAMVRIQHQ